MKTIRNMVIGMMMATLMLTMLAAPAVAEIDVYLYSYPGLGSAGYILDETENTKVDYYEYVDPWYYGDVMQLIWVGPDGVIDPADSNDPNYVGGDDVLNTWTDQDVPPAQQGHCIGEFSEEDGTFYINAWDSPSSRDWYIRVWNAATIGEATHYGDSPVVTCSGVGGEEIDFYPTTGVWSTTTPKPTFGQDIKKDLAAGWNLVSLPWVPEANSTDAVLGSITYDSVQEYDAVANEFETPTVMDPGIGYFILMDTGATWNYTGTEEYDSMTVQLKAGLNCIGWVNETGTTIPTALNSIVNEYNYDARFVPADEEYEVYEPNAPAEFNDFGTMDLGNGYWIAAKEDCELSYTM